MSIGDLTAAELRELALDPVLWVKCVLNATPDDWQGDILQSYVDRHLTAVRSATGVGKGALLSFIDLHYLHVGYLIPALKGLPGASDVQPKLILTSTDQTQLLSALWPEHKLWIDRSNGLGEIFEWQATTIRHRHPDYRDTWAAYAITSALRKDKGGNSQVGGSQGQHRPNMMISLDEAAHVEEAYWSAFLGTLSQAWNRLFAFGNPDMLSGMFYKIWHDKGLRDLWCRYTVSGRDDARPRAAASATSDRFFVSSRAAEGPNQEILLKTWGVDHPIVYAKVFGIHPTASLPNTAYAWQELQLARRQGRILPQPGDTKQIACDVARFGNAKTVYTIRHGRVFRQIKERKRSVNEIVDRLIELAEEEGDSDSAEGILIVIDETGVGGGVVDGVRRKAREKGLRVRVVGITFGGTPRQPNKYVNLAAEMWLEDAKNYFACLHCGQYYEAHFDDISEVGIVVAKSQLCPSYEPMSEVPDDDDLMNQAISRTYHIVKPTQTVHGAPQISRRAIQSKDEMDVSPDEMDSLCLACVHPKRSIVL